MIFRNQPGLFCLQEVKSMNIGNMFRPKLAVIAMGLIIFLCNTGRAEKNQCSIVLDTSYAGKYAHDDQFTYVKLHFHDIVGRSVSRIEKNLGKVLWTSDTIVFKWKDMPVSDTGYAFVRQGETYEEMNQDGATIVIAMYAESYKPMLKDWIEPELAHELVHANMMVYLREKHKSLPKWLKEGIAVYASGQGGMKVTRCLCENDKGPSSAINGLETAPHTMTDYAEDFLFFDRLANKYGAVTMHTIYRDIINGREYREAFAQGTGKAWPELAAELSGASKAWLTDYVGTQYESLSRGEQLMEQGQYVQALDRLRTINQDPYVSRAAYDCGKCYFYSKQYDQAVDAFKGVLLARRSFMDNAQYRLAQSYHRMKEFQKAIQAFEDYKMTYPWGENMRQIHFSLGQSYYRANEYASAAKNWEVFIEHPLNASATVLKGVLYQLGLCYIKIGENARARALFEQYVKSYPDDKRTIKINDWLGGKLQLKEETGIE